MKPTGKTFELVFNEAWQAPKSPTLYRKLFWWWFKVPDWAYEYTRIKTQVLNEPVQVEEGAWEYEVKMIDKRYKFV